jgi:hypothetical protein
MHVSDRSHIKLPFTPNISDSIDVKYVLLLGAVQLAVKQYWHITWGRAGLLGNSNSLESAALQSCEVNRHKI